MNLKSRSAIKVIAYAIENDTDSLKQLLIRNGIALDNNISKDELQLIVTNALAKSKTFKNEFKEWVLDRSHFRKYANSSGFAADPLIGSGIGYTPGSSGAYQLTNSQTQQTFGGLTIGAITPTTETGATTATTTPKPGGWNIDLNTILDFAKEGLNTYALALQTKNESNISNNALAMEREKINNQTKSGSNTTIVIAAVSVVAVATIVGVIYLNKKK